MKMTKTTPTIMKVLGLSPVVLGGVGEEGDVVVEPGARTVGGGGVADGAVVVVATTASPGGEEKGDGESPGVRVDDTIVAVIVQCIYTKTRWCYSTLLTYTEADYRS